ncbi:MAG: hypothetical protein IJW00_02390 [Clostridia bacterium]|nr:hypothetical protein [Clostridia bacterium]
MKDKTLLMAEAMSYIDDRFLEEAHPEACGLTQAKVDRSRTIRRIAAVACLCIVALGIAKLPDLQDMGTAGNAAPEAECPVNTTMDDGNGGHRFPAENEPVEEQTDAEQSDAEQSDAEQSDAEPSDAVHETETET